MAQKKCGFCGKVFDLSWPSAPHRFCSRSCASRWKHTQQSFRERFYTAARAKNISIALTGRTLSLKTRKAISERLKHAGCKPRIHGGNGTGPTKSERILLNALPNTIYNYVVKTGSRRRYLIDVALPNLKIAVEVDGPSHRALSVKKRDHEKEAFLKAHGWTVFRFTNEQVLQNLAECLKAIQTKG